MKQYKEIILYIFFGGLTTGVNWIIYICCNNILDVDMTLSNAVAWIGAVLFAFVTNKFWVFKSENKSISKILREGILFFASRLTTGIIEIVLPTVLFNCGLGYTLWGIEGFGAKALVSVIVVLLNYILSKKIVFSRN